MFEREIRDGAFIPRWQIVRTLRTQSIAEHSYHVAMYVNEICVFLKIDPDTHRRTLQYALWHDLRDEIISGDMPGPAKRRLVKDREHWDNTADEMATSIFGFHQNRMGMHTSAAQQLMIKAIVKVADWLDAACEMAGEAQLGNRNVAHHVSGNTESCVEAAKFLCNMIGTAHEGFVHVLRKAVSDAGSTFSRGPLISPTERSIAEDMESLGAFGPDLSRIGGR